MSKFIVFEWTGEIRGPRKGEHYETPGGDVLMCVEPDRAIGWYRIFRRLSDADVEALEARLAEAADHVHDLKLMEADRDAWKARAEKAEAERDDLRANAQHAAKLLAERDELTAEVDELRGIVATFRRMAGDADTRARFEREATLQFLQRVDFVEETGGVQVMRYESPKECHAKAKQAADVVFGPEPAPVKGDATPQYPAANPFMVYGPGACNPAPVPAPPEPWTPKVRDTVKIIASTYLPNDKTCDLIGRIAKVTDVDLSTVLVLGYMFNYSDLELVRRAEDSAS